MFRINVPIDGLYLDNFTLVCQIFNIEFKVKTFDNFMKLMLCELVVCGAVPSVDMSLNQWRTRSRFRAL